MEPRLIIKTHSEVSKPGLFSILISKCSYADKSSYPEVVSKRLYELYGENGQPFNKLAAKFVVIMAQRFGFLRKNMIWDWRGHVIHGALQYLNKAENENINLFLELTKLEKIIYLKYYLETDGAVILQLAKRIKEYNEINRDGLSKSIHLLFREIYEGYIAMSSNFQKRIELKERLKKIPQKGYDQKTVQHKVRPHIYPLIYLGILSNPEIKNGNEIYKAAGYNKLSTIELLLQELNDFQIMEKRFDDYEYFSIISKVLNLKSINFSVELHSNILRKTIIKGYSLLKENVTRMAYIDALVDWCCAKMLSEDNILISNQSICNFIEQIWRERPQSVRYHVDYRGRKSYVILSEKFGEYRVL